MTTPIRLPTDADPPFDVRWARWQERGAEQDRSLDRRAAALALLAFVALSAWLLVVVVA